MRRCCPAPDDAVTARRWRITPNGCETVAWTKDALSAMLKEVLAAHKLKMPQLAMPLRLL